MHFRVFFPLKWYGWHALSDIVGRQLEQDSELPSPRLLPDNDWRLSSYLDYPFSDMWYPSTANNHLAEPKVRHQSSHCDSDSYCTYCQRMHGIVSGRWLSALHKKQIVIRMPAAITVIDNRFIAISKFEFGSSSVNFMVPVSNVICTLNGADDETDHHWRLSQLHTCCFLYVTIPFQLHFHSLYSETIDPPVLNYFTWRLGRYMYTSPSIIDRKVEICSNYKKKQQQQKKLKKKNKKKKQKVVVALHGTINKLTISYIIT